MKAFLSVTTSLRVFMQVVCLFGLVFLPVVMVSFVYGESLWFAYLVFSLTLISLSWFFAQSLAFSHDLTQRQGFALLVFIWFGLGFVSGIPFVLGMDIAWIDAFFAGISGITTTGAEVFPDLSILPMSLRFYRMWLQFIGGLGVVILTLALFPFLGITHMHHMRSDLPGPNKSAVLPGKLSDLASVLWGIYLGLWLFCVGGLWWAGLDLFAAICESFSIVSTGGYGLHTGNLGYYQKPAVYAVSAFFMIVSSLNFGLHYQVLCGGGWSVYFRDREARTYLTCMFFVPLSILGLWWWGMPSFFAAGEVVFTTVSLMTSSGQQITHHLGWPVWLVFSWIILGVIGGTSGSTAGGIKWARVQFFFQELTNSLAILHHPRAVLPKGTGVEQIHGSASVNQVLLRSFLFAFLIFFLLGLVLCLWLGLDFATAFSSVSACISNTGVGFFGVESSFSSLSVGVKWVMLFLMLVGRIELLALMVVLSPSYWRMQ